MKVGFLASVFQQLFNISSEVGACCRLYYNVNTCLSLFPDESLCCRLSVCTRVSSWLRFMGHTAAECIYSRLLLGRMLFVVEAPLHVCAIIPVCTQKDSA